VKTVRICVERTRTHFAPSPQRVSHPSHLHRPTAQQPITSCTHLNHRVTSSTHRPVAKRQAEIFGCSQVCRHLIAYVCFHRGGVSLDRPTVRDATVSARFLSSIDNGQLLGHAEPRADAQAKCRDKNVIVLCSRRFKSSQNASKRKCGKWLTNQVE
jgi:hypothetical protein